MFAWVQLIPFKPRRNRDVRISATVPPVLFQMDRFISYEPFGYPLRLALSACLELDKPSRKNRSHLLLLRFGIRWEQRKDLLDLLYLISAEAAPLEAFAQNEPRVFEWTQRWSGNVELVGIHGQVVEGIQRRVGPTHLLRGLYGDLHLRRLRRAR